MIQISREIFGCILHLHDKDMKIACAKEEDAKDGVSYPGNL